MNEAASTGLCVQYGCGFSAPKTWRNFDSSPTLRFERIPVLGRFSFKNGRRFPANVEYGDIVKGLPLDCVSCDAIYCSHVLEHLVLDEFHTALRNTRSYLRGGGIFRLVVPDLESLARTYLADPSEAAAETFVRSSGLGLVHRPRGPLDLAKHWLGSQQHLWMWDYKALAAQLRKEGFVDVRRAVFGDSEDKRFGDVEDRQRFEASIAVQCRKP